MPARKQLTVGQRSRLRVRLLEWYRIHKRDLPWRHTHDPYAIWVSEIMLQQTRVAAVRERYGAFLAQFPSVSALAQANVADVLAVWSGLGYYRRARALHQAAREVVQCGGELPRTAEQWRTLPGIGRYTAAAIASIAYGEACAVVDGNVERVVRRVTADPASPPARIWETAGMWLSPKFPGDFNQAMMELGATICLPAAPRCDGCPVRAWCANRGALPAGPPTVRRQRETAYVLSMKRDAVYLKRRQNGERLMPGMWELPEIVPNGDAPAFMLRHAITVTDFRVSVFRVAEGVAGGRWVAVERLPALPLTGLSRKILRRAGII